MWGSLRALPGPVKRLLIRHGELARFALVGGFCFVLTHVVDYALKLTVLTKQPLTAFGLATIVATVASYVLNREWAFRTRGGRERRHEAALFFLVSAISVGLSLVPLGISRYVLGLAVPNVAFLTQEIADYVSSFLLGTLLGTVFRWWGFKKWVFPVDRGTVRERDHHYPETDEKAA
ncbi:GtrA family protein [Amycolatopsis sp. CA-230715]|uniref:GtrA family protein n=1 Tax=Amycolatopsis sp. CA-230715 TaxID=2745196 RepID=UPI001C02E5FE|nr:GtrA family protein [Amycolatopsis sp. CA-230715]QWF79294.1 hypothetical protein HUW46_02701 [Amycolatopsis sp. CA-230715]